MKVAIIGASGKTGTQLVRESLKRGYQVSAVCRHSSVEKLDEFAGRDGFTVMTAPVVSDETILTRALSGCDAVVVDLKDDAGAAYTTHVQKELLRNGYILAQRPGLDVLRIDPVLTIESRDIENFLTVFENVLTDKLT